MEKNLDITKAPPVNATKLVAKGSKKLAMEIYDTVLSVGHWVVLAMIPIALLGLLWESKRGNNDKVTLILKWVLGICITLALIDNLPGIISWIVNMFKE